MHRDAQGILAIWHNIAGGHCEDTLAWYDREHHAERVGIPGFLSARRYMALEGTPELFIRYETTSPEVLSSTAYLEHVNNPTRWSLRGQMTIENNSRTVCRIARRTGESEGGFVLTAQLGAAPSESVVAAWDQDGTIERLTGRSGILSAELWLADAARSAIPTREKELRGVVDQHASATLVVHATDEKSLREAAAAELAGSRLLQSGEGAEIRLFRLAFSLESVAISDSVV